MEDTSTENALRAAWQRCRHLPAYRRRTFQQALAEPALAIPLRNLAACKGKP